MILRSLGTLVCLSSSYPAKWPACSVLPVAWMGGLPSQMVRVCFPEATNKCFEVFSGQSHELKPAQPRLLSFKSPWVFPFMTFCFIEKCDFQVCLGTNKCDSRQKHLQGTTEPAAELDTLWDSPSASVVPFHR
jgi:hypothetical protein